MKTDLQIKKDVLAELEWDPAIDAAHIGVEVSDGIVTLTGHISSYPEKVAAERAAQRVAGVKGVAMEIQVKLPGISARTDADIASAAVYALRWDTLVPEDRIKLKVEQGAVTLTGNLDWAFQRAAAESCIRNLVGVKEVINLLSLKAKPSPKALRSKIEAALQRAAHFDARDISIDVKGGKVTLEGSVHSLSQRRMVERAVWAAPGITEVVDHLAVAD